MNASAPKVIRLLLAIISAQAITCHCEEFAYYQHNTDRVTIKVAVMKINTSKSFTDAGYLTEVKAWPLVIEKGATYRNVVDFIPLDRKQYMETDQAGGRPDSKKNLAPLPDYDLLAIGRVLRGPHHQEAFKMHRNTRYIPAGFSFKDGDIIQIYASQL